MSGSEAGSVAGEVYVTYLCPVKERERLRDLYVVSPFNFRKFQILPLQRKRAIK